MNTKISRNKSLSEICPSMLQSTSKHGLVCCYFSFCLCLCVVPPLPHNIERRISLNDFSSWNLVITIFTALWNLDSVGRVSSCISHWPPLPWPPPSRLWLLLSFLLLLLLGVGGHRLCLRLGLGCCCLGEKEASNTKCLFWRSGTSHETWIRHGR